MRPTRLRFPSEPFITRRVTGSEAPSHSTRNDSPTMSGDWEVKSFVIWNIANVGDINRRKKHKAVIGSNLRTGVNTPLDLIVADERS